MAEPRVQDAEAHLRRLGRQAVALFEVASARGPRHGPGQHEIQQFRQQRLAAFDELRVHAGDIELAQVEAAPRVCAKPEQHRQYPLPLGRVFQRDQRLARQPRRQFRQFSPRDRGQRAEARRIVHLPDQLQRLALARHHNARRHPIASQQAMVHLAPLDAVPASRFPTRGSSCRTSSKRSESARVSGPRRRNSSGNRFSPLTPAASRRPLSH